MIKKVIFRRLSLPVWLAALALLLAVVHASYANGWRFGYSFDDEIHLDGLSQVHDPASALHFVFSGSGGSFGRPVALASFLLQLPSWPAEPADFVRANTLIHLLNALLVIWLACRLSRCVPANRLPPHWFGLAAGSLWALSPLLLSSSMMVIQRMNTLCASFTLAGLLAFVAGRQMLARDRSGGMVLMTAGVGLGTLLAVLSKENGALLPFFALCLEYFLLAPAAAAAGVQPQPRVPRWWLALFLWLPALALLAYMAHAVGRAGIVYPGRSFDMIERLLTESRILFQYLRLLVLPKRSEIGPFQDDFPVSTGLLEPSVTLLAVLAWPLLAAVAWTLRRGRFRLFSFGLFWFLAGHLLESSVFGLELYFEHRNYLPSVGVYIGLVGLLAAVPSRQGLAALGFFVMLANSVFVLRESSLLWRSPALAGAMWHRDSPGSLRALQLHAYELASAGDPQAAVPLLQNVPPSMRMTPAFQLYRLQLYCDLMPEPAMHAAVTETFEALRSQPVDAGASVQIARLQGKSCPGLEQATIRRMFEQVIAAGGRASSTAVAGAHYQLAKDAMDRGLLDATMYHLQQGFSLMPQLGSAMAMVNTLLSAGLPAEARQTLEELRSAVPRNPLLREVWLQALAELERNIDTQSVPHRQQPPGPAEGR